MRSDRTHIHTYAHTHSRTYSFTHIPILHLQAIQLLKLMNLGLSHDESTNRFITEYDIKIVEYKTITCQKNE